jgi:hypothetical protein
MGAAGDSGGRKAYDVVRALRYCARPEHLRRTVTIALIVGTWVTFLNQGDALLSGAFGAGLAVGRRAVREQAQVGDDERGQVVQGGPDGEPAREGESAAHCEKGSYRTQSS